ncbi:MAG: hypothetical protein ACRD1H_07380, partial [Vicinamibacterales bacterium]
QQQRDAGEAAANVLRCKGLRVRAHDVRVSAPELPLLRAMTTKPDAGPATAVPTFLNVDSRVPGALRDLLAEADGCLKMGFLLGGTVCAQRAIQTLLTLEDVNGPNDDARLRALSDKYAGVPKVLFAVCARFREASAGDQTPLDKERLNLLMVTLKFMLYEIYVIARERTESLEHLQKILERLDGENTTAQSSAVLAFAKQ